MRQQVSYNNQQLIIYIAINCHVTSLKKTSGHVGTRTCVAGLRQQTCDALDHHAWWSRA